MMMNIILDLMPPLLIIMAAFIAWFDIEKAIFLLGMAIYLQISQLRREKNE